MLKNRDRCIYRSLDAIVTVLIFILPIFAQSGGQFVINQSVISNGGVSQSAAGQFTLAGTIGQTVAGQVTANPPLAAHAGFWIADVIPAATYNLSGKVTTSTGNGLKNATVAITDSHGALRKAITTSFGFYQFDNVTLGESYVMYVVSKRFRFSTRNVVITDTLTNVDFTGIE